MRGVSNTVGMFAKRRLRHRKLDRVEEKIWGLPTEYKRKRETGVNAYLDHYDKTFVLASTLDAFTYRRDVVDLVELIRSKTTESIDNITDAIRQASSRWRNVPFTPDEAVEALGFALQLWLFANPQLDQRSMTLEQTNKAPYVQAQIQQPPGGSLSSDFSAKSLTRKAGFYLVWTSDLSKHLTFASKDQLRVFRHAYVLQKYQRQIESTLFPPELLSETHRTLNLLFPIEDLKTSQRVKRLARRKNVDVEAPSSCVSHLAGTSAFDIEKAIIEHSRYDLSSYIHYGARLAEIQRRYDLARPRRLTQWWYDRRQRPEWAALMVALVVFLLTVLFGVAQTVTGVLQVISSWHRS